MATIIKSSNTVRRAPFNAAQSLSYRVSKCCPSSKHTSYTPILPPVGHTYLPMVSVSHCHVYATGLKSCESMLYPALHVLELQAVSEIDAAREASQAQWRNELQYMNVQSGDVISTSEVFDDFLPDRITRSRFAAQDFCSEQFWFEGAPFNLDDPFTNYYARPEYEYYRKLKRQLPELDEYLKVLEAFALSCYFASKATTFKEKSLVMLNYCSIVLPNSIIGSVAQSQSVQMLLVHFSDLYRNNVQATDDNVHTLRECLNNYELMKKSPIYTKVYRFIMYALSLSLFDKFGISFDSLNFNDLEAEAIKKKHHMGFDFMMTSLDTILYIVEKARQYQLTGSFQGIFTSEAKFQIWFDKCTTLMRQSKYLSNPELHGIEIHSYLSDINKVIEKGKYIKKFSSTMTIFEKSMVSKNLQDMENIRCQFINKTAAAKDRKAPFSLLIYGGSSVGKSSILHTIFVHFGKVFGLKTESEYKYTRLAHEKHWSNFSTEQWCIVLDDIAMLKPSACQGIDPSLAEVILLNNNVAFTPEQAALENKGNTPAIPKLLLATTNTDDLNVHAYFSCPLAVSRRLPWVIDVKPKPQYSKEQCMLDGTLLPDHKDGTYNDFWIFKVLKVVPSGTERNGQRAKLQEFQEFDNIDDFLQWMSLEALAHDKQQDVVMNSGRISKDVEICNVCYRSRVKCVCIIQNTEVQSLDSVDYMWLSLIMSISALLYKYYNAFVLYMFYKYAYSRVWNFILNKTRLIHLISLSAYFVSRSTASSIFEYMGHRVHNLKHDKIGKFIIFIITISAAYKMFSYGKSFFVDSDLISLENKDKEIMKLKTKMHNMEKDRHLACMRYLKKRGHFNADDAEFFNTILNEEADDEECTIDDTVDSANIGSSLEPDKNFKNNVWYNPHIPMSTFDVPTASLSLVGKDRNFIVDLISRNTVMFKSTRTVEGRVAVRHTRGVCLIGHIYVCNNHGLPDDQSFELTVLNSNVDDSLSTNITFNVDQEDIMRDPDNDLAFMNIRHLPLKSNIMKFFAKTKINDVCDGFYLGRDKNGEVDINDVIKVKLVRDALAPTGLNHDMYCGYASRPGVVGDCGNILILETGYGPILSGFHYLGNEERPTVLSIALTFDMLNSAVQKMNVVTMEPGVPMLSSDTKKRELIDTHPKCVLRFIPQAKGQLYGSFKGFKPNPKSHVKPSVIVDSMINRGFEVKHGPPVMKGWQPWRNAALDMTNPVSGINSQIMMQCKEAYLNDILKEIDPDELKQVKILDDFTAINGCAGVAYVDKINHNTSAGAPWKKSKKYFLEPLPPQHGFDEPVEFNEEIKSRINKIIQNYKAGLTARPVFCGNLKDEAKTFSKIKKGKTRVFTGSPADWSHVVRKYYLSLVRLIQNNKHIFECATGTVCQSLEWEQLYELLTTFSKEHNIAGDFEAYDKRMAAILILEAFSVLIELALASGNYDKEELLVLVGIAEDVAFNLVDFNGDLIAFLGSNPSGHPLTVIINSIVNSLYMRYCFAILGKLHEVEVKDFKTFVKLMTYGDDNASGVSPEIPWFNHTSIKAVLAEAGIGYTMADKTAESVPYIPIEKVSFLKRTWRWDEDVKAFLCPLEMDSITKSLTVTVKSRSVSPKYQAIQTIGTAVREFFYYGKEKFEEMSNMLKEIVLENDLQPYVEDSTFPTWDSLYKSFWDASTHIKLRRQL